MRSLRKRLSSKSDVRERPKPTTPLKVGSDGALVAQDLDPSGDEFAFQAQLNRGFDADATEADEREMDEQELARYLQSLDSVGSLNSEPMTPARASAVDATTNDDDDEDLKAISQLSERLDRRSRDEQRRYRDEERRTREDLKRAKAKSTSNADGATARGALGRRDILEVCDERVQDYSPRTRNVRRSTFNPSLKDAYDAIAVGSESSVGSRGTAIASHDAPRGSAPSLPSPTPVAGNLGSAGDGGRSTSAESSGSSNRRRSGREKEGQREEAAAATEEEEANAKAVLESVRAEAEARLARSRDRAKHHAERAAALEAKAAEARAAHSAAALRAAAAAAAAATATETAQAEIQKAHVASLPNSPKGKTNVGEKLGAALTLPSTPRAQAEVEQREELKDEDEVRVAPPAVPPSSEPNGVQDLTKAFGNVNEQNPAPKAATLVSSAPPPPNHIANFLLYAGAKVLCGFCNRDA